MIAPEPFFEPRGTPFSEFHRIRALTAARPSSRSGHVSVRPRRGDARTAGLSEPAAAVRPPREIGPSLAKIPLDCLLALTAVRRALSGALRRDPLARRRRAHRRRARGAAADSASLRHALEPAAAAHEFRVQPVAAHARRVSRDRAPDDPPLARRHRHLSVARRTRCARSIRGAGRPDRERARIGGRAGDPGAGGRRARAASDCRRRRRWSSTPARSRPIRGWTCCSPRWRTCARAIPDARLLLAGGKPEQVETRQGAGSRGGHRRRHDFRRRAAGAEIPAYLQACDVLVSPRSRGTNTPLKIYQYLRSGKPIVATRLLTHTQVLSDETAILTGATPRTSATGILAAIARPGTGGAVGRAGARAGGDEVQLRGIPRTHATGAARRCSGPSTPTAASRRRPVRERTSREPVAVARSLQLHASMPTRRPRGPSTSAALAVPSAIWSRARRRTRCCASSAPIRDRTILDVGTGTGRAALFLARAGRQ